MSRLPGNRRVVRYALVLLVVAAPIGAEAQDRPGPVAEFAAGWIGFADDGVVSEALVGGAARWYALPRLALGPEVVYIQGNNHSHLVATVNMTFDLLPPLDGRPRSVTPFLIAGAGLFETRESFFNETFSSGEGTFTMGGGVRAALADRVTVGVDARVGWELHLRVNGVIGVQFGR